MICDGCGGGAYRNETTGQFVPLKKCSRCHQASYHNVQCQKQHYKIHKLICCSPTSAAVASSDSKENNNNNKNNAIMKANNSNGSSSSPNNTISTMKKTMGYVIEERIGRGKCMFATKSYTNMEPILSNIQPVIPPVLSKDQRMNRCAICLDRVVAVDESTKESKLHSHNTAFVLSDHFKYTVLVCTGCYNHKKPQWLIDETKLVTKLLNALGEHHEIIIFPNSIMVFRAIMYCMLSKENEDNIMNLHSYQQDRTTKEFEVGSEGHALEWCTSFTVSRLIEMELAMNDKQHFRRKKLQNLQAKYSSGHTSYNHQHTAMVEYILNVLHRLHTNIFTIMDVLDDEEYFIQAGNCLYADPVSRINHSCEPNATQRFEFHSGTGYPPTLNILSQQTNDMKKRNRTNAVIEKNDEICISYTDREEQDKMIRKGILSTKYHFNCTCVKCSL